MGPKKLSSKKSALPRKVPKKDFLKNWTQQQQLQQQQGLGMTEGVDHELSDLQSSLESIKSQLELLEGGSQQQPLLNKKRSHLQELNVSSSLLLNNPHSIKQKTPTPKPPPMDPEQRKEMVKKARATPLRDGYQCEYCKDTETPMWRGGPSGPRTLCNKCGVKWRAGRIFKDRPPPPPIRTFTTKRTGYKGMVRKRSSGDKSSSSSSSGAAHSSSKGKKRVISLAQKLAMANAISNPNIDEDVLIHVVETIRSSLPGLQKNEEVEIDMDKLGNNTLVKLYDYLEEEGILN